MEQQPESIPPIQQSLHERLTLSDEDKVRVPRTGNRATSFVAAVVLYTLPAVVVVLCVLNAPVSGVDERQRRR